MTYLDDMDAHADQREEEERAQRILSEVIGGSKCKKRQVSAVAFSMGHPVGFGYNEPREPGLTCADHCPRWANRDVVEPLVSSYDHGAGACIAIHAEEMAIDTADAPIDIVYVSCVPCYRCETMMRDLNIPWKVLSPVH